MTLLINIRKFSNKCRKQLLDTGIETASKKVVHKAAEATGEIIENKIADKIEKPKHVFDENPRNLKEITVLPEKREEISNKLREVL